MITFYSDCYRMLELYPEVPGAPALITVSDGTKQLRRRARNLDRVTFPLQKYTEYSLSLGGAALSLAYLSGCDGLADRGVRFLRPDGSLVQTEVPSAAYHFTPFRGRLYAPGALCFYQNRYHILYPCAPFADFPDVFCLAHAVSADLVRWHHLPLCFFPPSEMRLARHTAGGVIDGCAAVEEDRVRLYLSHSIARTDGQLLREYVLGAESRDMLHFSEAAALPGVRPPAGYGPAFRNPKLAETKEGLCMTVGSAREDRGAVLLFRQAGNRWSYVRPLLRDKDAAFPDFFAIGRTHALLASATDAAHWYTGTLQEAHFRVRQRGQLDFGSDFHAPRTFLQGGRRLLFAAARLAGCMTIPRELFTRAGRLLTRPALEAYAPFCDVVYDGAASGTFPLPAASLVRLSGTADFSFRLGTAVLRRTDGRLCLETPDAVHAAETGPVRTLELFIDGPLLELFVNDGEAAATFYLPDGDPASLTCTGHGRLQIFPATVPAGDAPPDPDAPVDTFDFAEYSFG